MSDSEIIRLDARLVDVVAHSAFGAELANGHRLIAFLDRGEKEAAGALAPGMTVQVEMSPFDMSKGHIVCSQETRGGHEG